MYIKKKQTPFSAASLVVETLVLLIVELYLIVILCKYFRRDMREEIRTMIIIQSFFCIGFIYRTYHDIRHINKNDSEPSGLEQFFSSILPIFYEALPIFVVYLHHTLNFR